MCEEDVEGRVGEMEDGWMGSGAMGAAEEDASPDMVGKLRWRKDLRCIRSFKRALDQHALFMNLLCWLSGNVPSVELMDWVRLKIRCGVSRGSAANQDLTWESPVRTTKYGHSDILRGLDILLYCSFACTKITP